MNQFRVNFNCFNGDCLKPLEYYLNFHPLNSLVQYKRFVCYHCRYTNVINPSQYQITNIDNKKYVNENKNETKQKMKIEKIEIGNYLNTEDYNLGDKVELKICDSGRMEDCNFQGKKSSRMVIKVENKEFDKIKDFSLSPKRQNKLLEKFGDDSDKWVDEVFTVLVESCDVGKTGLQFTIM